jgi:hypothetical protein
VSREPGPSPCPAEDFVYEQDVFQFVTRMELVFI